MVGATLAGVSLGSTHLDTAGGWIGGALGLIAGWLLGRLPGAFALWWVGRTLGQKNIAQLRAELRSDVLLAPNVILQALARQGHDLREELPLVLDLMQSDSQHRRSMGWVALLSVYPEVARQLPDYRVNAPVQVCRDQVSQLVLGHEGRERSDGV